MNEWIIQVWNKMGAVKIVNFHFWRHYHLNGKYGKKIVAILTAFLTHYVCVCSRTIQVRKLICKMFIWITIVLHINEVWPELCPTYKRGPSSEITCDHEGRNLLLLRGKKADLLSCRTVSFSHSLSLTLHLLIRSYAAEMWPRHSSFKHHYHNLLFCLFEGKVSPRLKPTAEALHAILYSLL